MEEFDALVQIIHRLLAPDGCPWDREQTLQSLRSSLVEETYEVIEAIDLNHPQQLEEEVGDLFFNLAFLCQLAEKEHLFTLKDVLKHVVAKLVRRHPHIFGEVNLKTSEEVLKQWEEIKHSEKKAQPRLSALDGIPKDLPALARAQKVAKKLVNQHFVPEKASSSLTPEEQAGQALWSHVQELSQQGIQAEQALRQRLSQIEEEFRGWEKKKGE